MSSKEVPLTVLVQVVPLVTVEEVVRSDRIGEDGLEFIETVDDEISVSCTACTLLVLVVCDTDDKVVGVLAVFGHASVAKVLLLRGSSSL